MPLKITVTWWHKKRISANAGEISQWSAGTSSWQMEPHVSDMQRKRISAIDVENCWLRMCANVAVKIAGPWPAVLWIRDVYPGSLICPSRIRIFPSRTRTSRIRIKDLIILSQKWFLSTQKYIPGFSSRIRILIFYPSRMPDPGVKKAPDPESRIRNTAGQLTKRAHSKHGVRKCRWELLTYACTYTKIAENYGGTWWSILRPDEPIGHVEVGRVIVDILHNDRELRHVLQSRARTVLVLREVGTTL